MYLELKPAFAGFLLLKFCDSFNRKVLVYYKAFV